RQAYESHCAGQSVSDQTSWSSAHKAFVEARIKGRKPFVPDTFVDINADAQTDAIADNLLILRVEDLRRPLADQKLELTDLRAWQASARGRLQKKDVNPARAQARLEEFLDNWNSRRDFRPAFAAFEHELGSADNLATGDWPHLLRNRLGLAHYDGERVPVALMGIKPAEVRSVAARHVAASFARPTVLDGTLNGYFFPTPADIRFGATLDLDPGAAWTFTSEILHFPVDYLPRHLIALGEIGASVPSRCLRALRDRHLKGLQAEPGGAGFGELIGSADCLRGPPCR
ncbi:MAG: hypothetical protein Q8L92_17375, partial [Rubrivivax sp.]|nr:hypothetical protein [Rubrivivax sp.]